MKTLDTYFAYLEQKGLSEKTIKTHQSNIKRFLDWFIEQEQLDQDGLLALRQVTTKDVNGFKRTAGKGYTKRDGSAVKALKVGSINKILAQLKQCFAWMMDQGLIPDNPCQDVDLIPEERLKAKWLDKQQERKLRNELRIRNNIREMAIIEFFLYTGVRVDELCGITLDDITLGQYTAWDLLADPETLANLNERSGTVWIRGKGSKQREVDLHKELRATLKKYLQFHGPKLKGDHLFDTKRSDKLEPRTVEHMVSKYGKLCGFKITPHMLRHTCLHNLMVAEKDPFLVAEIAGHMKKNGMPNIDMTYRYVKPSREERANAIDRALSWRS
jgi:site-specific recombinase XerD